MLTPLLRRSPAVLASLVVFGLIAAAVGFATNPGKSGVTLPDPIDRDLSAILARDTVVALTSYTSTSYFLYRGDPTQWGDVAFWLLQKSREEVYNRPEVRHGYCRGLEPVQYVERILNRYAHYDQFVKDESGNEARV